jgi:hypothetical protein
MRIISMPRAPFFQFDFAIPTARTMRKFSGLFVLILSACSVPGGPYPSLRPRAAEAIDPRIPVVKPMNDRPAAASLMARLSALVDQARSGNGGFDTVAAEAERLAASAGAPQSESWIAAEEALTAAIAARRTTAQALADIDEIAATTLQNQRGIAPNDLAAIQNAASEVASIDIRQGARIDAIQKRLGL